MGETLLLTFMMIAMIYFMVVRPESKRKKAAETLRSSLKEGDEITTIGGITGKICAIKESTVVFETGADRVRLEVAKWAIANKGIVTNEAVR